ncbi:MAG: hypothetical protein U1E14_12950 [Geminicoccaceae bacterium]
MGTDTTSEPTAERHRDLQLQVLGLCLQQPRSLAELCRLSAAPATAIATVLRHAIEDGVVRRRQAGELPVRYELGSGRMRTMVATLLMLDRTTRWGGVPRSPDDGWAA